LIKIAVLGGSSFCGGAFLEHALDCGLELMSFQRGEIGNQGWEIGIAPDRCSSLDINNSSSLREMVTKLRKFRPEVIVNFISQGMVAPSWNAPRDWYRTNLLGTSELIEAISDLPSVQRFIHFSTPEVYGNTGPSPADESFGFNPSTPYALSRAAAEQHLALYQDKLPFDVVITRASNVYGLGQQLYRVIPNVFLCCQRGQRFTLDGGGRSKRNFLHKTCMARGILSVIESGISGEAYNLSGDRFISILELVQLAVEIAGKKPADVIFESEERLGKDSYYCLSNQKAIADLDWNPDVGLEQGLALVHRWIQSIADQITLDHAVYKHRP